LRAKDYRSRDPRERESPSEEGENKSEKRWNFPSRESGERKEKIRGEGSWLSGK